MPKVSKKEKEKNQAVFYKKTVTYKKVEYDVEVGEYIPMNYSSKYNCEIFINNERVEIESTSFLNNLSDIKRVFNGAIKRYRTKQDKKNEIKNWNGKL